MKTLLSALLATILALALQSAPPARAGERGDHGDHDDGKNGPGTTDFSFFDNTGPEGPTEGVQCTAEKPFAYQISVSQWAPTPNVVRVTIADGDLTRYQIAGNGSLQLAGFARGGTKKTNFPDRCITVCAEVPGQMAGQVSVQTQEPAKPKLKCNDVVCGPGGSAPACP